MEFGHPNEGMERGADARDHGSMLRPMVLVLAAIAACGGDAMMAGDARDYAETIDADLGTVDATDAPPGACPDVTIPQPTPPSATPTGTRRAVWRCTGGCARYAAPSITLATMVDLGGGVVRWRTSSGTIAVHLAIATGGCWRVAPDEDDGCRAYYDVCARSGGHVGIETATWYDAVTHWRQSWEMVEP